MKVLDLNRYIISKTLSFLSWNFAAMKIRLSCNEVKFDLKQQYSSYIQVCSL